jgi:hypothetical protein
MPRQGAQRPSFNRSQSAFEGGMAGAIKPLDSHVQLLQMALPRRASDGNPRFSAQSQVAAEYASHDMIGHNRNATASSTWASTFASTSGPLTPSDDGLSNNRYSWHSPAPSNDANAINSALRNLELNGPPGTTTRLDVSGETRQGSVGLMGTGHFGPAVRDKVAEVLRDLIGEVPMGREEDEVVCVCEFGALNGRCVPSSALSAPTMNTIRSSASLMTDIISPLARRHDILMPSGTSSQASFFVTHCDAPQSDFRPISTELELSELYLSDNWQRRHQPPLTDRVFSAFVARPRAMSVLPPKSVSVGISLFDLHWAQAASRIESSAAASSRELDAFLQARAAEFRPGGLLVMAYVRRSIMIPLLSAHMLRRSSGPRPRTSRTGRSRSGPRWKRWPPSPHRSPRPSIARPPSPRPRRLRPPLRGPSACTASGRCTDVAPAPRPLDPPLQCPCRAATSGPP